MLRNSPMPTGQFEMAPLHEFVVTVTTPRSHLEPIDIFVWMSRQGVLYNPDYSSQTVEIYGSLPSDCEPTLAPHHISDGWKLKWDCTPS